MVLENAWQGLLFPWLHSAPPQPLPVLPPVFLSQHRLGFLRVESNLTFLARCSPTHHHFTSLLFLLTSLVSLALSHWLMTSFRTPESQYGCYIANITSTFQAGGEGRRMRQRNKGGLSSSKALTLYLERALLSRTRQVICFNILISATG